MEHVTPTQVPTEIEPLRARLREFTQFKTSVVYFLIFNEALVYIGRSRSLANRLPSHWDKSFDRVLYMTVPDDAVESVEAALIQRFNPVYNRQEFDYPYLDTYLEKNGWFA